MALVLAIEPDLRQAEILTRIVREKVKADVVIVDSRDAAMEAMRSAMPDVMLLSALLSPRDEDELVAHLRTLEDAEHLQTHTIPQLASSGGGGKSGSGRGLLKSFLRKKDTQPAVAGCDPELFAQEIRLYLDQAEQMRRERAEGRRYRPAAPLKPAAAPEPKAAEGESNASSGGSASWDSPFEWRRTDTAPAPLSSFEEEPVAGAPAYDSLERPADDLDSGSNPHPLEASSLAPAEAEPESHQYTDVAPAPPPEPPMSVDRLLEAGDELAAPELFETFVPAPVAEIESAVPDPGAALVAVTAPEQPAEIETPTPPPVFDVEPALEQAPVESIVEPEVTVDALVAAPEKAEASIDTSVPEIDYARDTVEEFQRMFAAAQEDAVAAPAAQVVPAPDDLFAIDCFIDAEAIESEAPDATTLTVATTPAPSPEPDAEAEQAIDLSWADVQHDPQEETAVAVAVDEEDAAPSLARTRPPVLGPLATWARLERKSEDARTPGSDMREIIDRLAVPPHIAGVSYARGVRIRRVRVAGGGGRRRPGDPSGPVILSRRALAATRTGGPATA